MMTDSDERVLSQDVKQLIDDERAMSKDVQRIVIGGRAIMWWSVGAVPVLLFIAGGIWYLAIHMQAYAQTEKMAHDNADAIEEHESESMKLLRRIDRRLGHIEGAVGAHHGQGSSPPPREHGQ